MEKSFALENNGSPKPIFETDEGRTSFAVTLLIHPDFKQKETSSRKGNDSNDSNDSNANAYRYRNYVYTETSQNVQRFILKSIIEQPDITVSTLSDLMDVSQSTVLRGIKTLKQKGILVRKGSSRRGLWIVQKELIDTDLNDSIPY